MASSSAISVKSSRSGQKGDRLSQTELGFIRLNDNSKCNESSNSSRKKRIKDSRKSSVANSLDDLKGDLVRIESKEVISEKPVSDENEPDLSMVDSADNRPFPNGRESTVTDILPKILNQALSL